jgi:hypothetical protein
VYTRVVKGKKHKLDVCGIVQSLKYYVSFPGMFTGPVEVMNIAAADVLLLD